MSVYIVDVKECEKVLVESVRVLLSTLVFYNGNQQKSKVVNNWVKLSFSKSKEFQMSIVLCPKLLVYLFIFKNINIFKVYL